MLQNYWYIACASAQLTDKPVASRVLDQRIVLFRNEFGKVQCLLDRCCHRGLPLSKGKLVSGRIQCGYHGWQYDGTGSCRVIPSQEQDMAISPVYAVKSFACDERDGYIWVWIGGGEPMSKPAIAEFSGIRWKQGSRLVNCNYLRALEITFDSTHVYVAHPAHPATIAAKKHGLPPTDAELRLTDNGCIVISPPTASDHGPVPRTSGTMEFMLPGRIRFCLPSPQGAYYMNFHIIPVGDTQCRIEFLVQNPSLEGPDVEWITRPADILEEDAEILEAVQATYDRESEAFECSVEADAPPMLVRRIIGLACTGHWQGLHSDLPKRRIVPRYWLR